MVELKTLLILDALDTEEGRCLYRSRHAQPGYR